MGFRPKDWLRAQIPGTYNVMPSKGMLMYYPDYNGSGVNAVFRIIDKPPAK